MSSSPNATLLLASQADHADAFAIYAASALIVYEYMITARQELLMVWMRKWTVVTWIFVLNRYLMAGVMIWTIAPYNSQTWNIIQQPGTSRNIITTDIGYTCPPSFAQERKILNIAQYVLFSAFLALRVFAIWNYNTLLALIVLTLSLIPVLYNIYAFTQSIVFSIPHPVLGCIANHNRDNFSSVSLHLALAAGLGLILANSLVLALTWRKTFKRRTETEGLGIGALLDFWFLQNGAVYFVGFLLISFVQLLLSTVPMLHSVTPITTIMAALNPILVSRFLLNLQQVEGGEINNTNTSSKATLRDLWLFVTISRLGDLGGDLDHGPEPEEVEILMEEFDVRDVSEEASRDEEAARVVDIRLEIVPQALPVEENPFEEFVVGSSRDIQEVPRFGHWMTQEIS